MTPIDPNDTSKLAAIHEEAADYMCEGCWFNAPAGAGAVARAVLPEGYVAVPIADLREIAYYPEYVVPSPVWARLVDLINGPESEEAND